MTIKYDLTISTCSFTRINPIVNNQDDRSWITFEYQKKVYIQKFQSFKGKIPWTGLDNASSWTGLELLSKARSKEKYLNQIFNYFA